MIKSRITAVGVITKDDLVLLGKKPKDIGPYPNTWIIPGGGVDLAKETVTEALVREIREEAGIEIQNVQPLLFMTDQEPDKRGEMTYYIHLVYTAQYASGTLRAGDDVMTLEWIPIKKIPELTVARPSVTTFRKLGWLT